MLLFSRKKSRIDPENQTIKPVSISQRTASKFCWLGYCWFLKSIRVRLYHSLVSFVKLKYSGEQAVDPEPRLWTIEIAPTRDHTCNERDS